MKTKTAYRLFVACSLLISLNSCFNTSNHALDPRPADQVGFIAKTILLDTLISNSKNEIIREERTAEAISKMTDFVKDSLNYKFTDWPAEVLEIENNPSGFSVVNVTYMIRKNILDPAGDHPEYSSIIFDQWISKKDQIMIDKVKKFKPRQRILISGLFSLKRNKVDVTDNLTLSNSSIFENPKFSVNLSDIKSKDNL